MANQNAGVLGTGHAYPEGILTNADLEKMVETSDEWISSRTGIRKRRLASPEDSLRSLSVQACQNALAMAGVDA
ncbi:MAG: 3-oxoacyl-ACP synthase, partial [Pyrinomonadaceae bacterium]|nr:3-oxoacyl-ACP synthase [Pyrinomonadaceae bacterium]